MNKWFGK